MTLDELGKLQAYFYVISFGCVLACVWILPGLVAALTPFRYRDIMRVSQDALLTAFTTGNLFVMLPILSDNAKTLYANADLKNKMTEDEAANLVDIIVPVAFNFPNVGKLMMLVFIPFAAWYSGVSMGLAENISFAVSGLVTFFGSVNVAIPFLLDALRIPADMFELFVLSTVVNTRVTTIAAAMHVLFLALVGLWAIAGHLRWNPVRVGRYLGTTTVILVVVIGGGRFMFSQMIDESGEETADVLFDMQLPPLNPEPPMSIVQANSVKADKNPSADTLTRIKERGVVRLGYRADAYPFSFLNDDGELVGYSIELCT